MVLCTGLSIFLTLTASAQQGNFGTKYYDFGSSPSSAELGRINLDAAVALSKRLIEKVYCDINGNVQPIKLQLSPKQTYAVDLRTKALTISFFSSFTIFSPVDGKIQAGAFLGIVSTEPKVRLDDAKRSAGDYFHFFEPNSTYTVELERMSGIDYQFMVCRTINGIRFETGLNCWIDGTEGRLRKFLYSPSYPLHASARVGVAKEGARENASEALARFRPNAWIEFLPEQTVVHYSIPPVDNQFIEMNDEQMSIGKQRKGIPVFRFEARQVAMSNAAQRVVERYFVYVDARNGRAMSIVPIIPQGITTKAVTVNKPRPRTLNELRVLNNGKWTHVPNSEISITSLDKTTKAGKQVSISTKDLVWNAHYDSKSGLIWDTSGDGWVGKANPELRRFLENVKPVFPRFGKQK